MEDLVNRKYLFISNSKHESQICFSFCGKYDALKIKNYYPALKISYDTKLNLESGHLYENGQFQIVSIDLYKTKIANIKISKDSENQFKIISDLSVLDEKQSLFIAFQIEKEGNSATSLLDFLFSTIRFLNLCAKESRDLKRLSQTNPLKYHYPKIDGIYIVKKFVTNLNIEYFENGKSTPGKDDHFWNEVEIEILDKLQIRYLEQLLVKALSKMEIITNKIENKIIGRYNFDRGWLAFKGRKKISEDPIFISDMKDSLMMLIFKEFSEDEYYFEQNTINSSSLI